MARFRGPTADGIRREGPRYYLERDGECTLEGRDSRKGLVVAGRAGKAGLGDDRRRDRRGKVSAAEEGDPPANPIKEVSYFAVCVDTSTGKIQHDIKLGTEQNPAYCHPFNSYASPTPFIEPGRLYAHFGSHGTWAVDTATGKPLWERRDLRCDHFRGPASSPIVYGDLLYLIFDGFDLQYVAALDKATGETVWKTDRKIKYKTDNGDYKKAYATPAIFLVDGNPQLVCPSAECTIAYDPKTGNEIWRVSHGGMNGSARPVMADGLVYLTSGHDKKLLALKPGATGLIPADSVKWLAAKDVSTRPSLLIDGGLLYMVSDNGIASCLDAATGKVYYSERIDGEYSTFQFLQMAASITATRSVRRLC